MNLSKYSNNLENFQPFHSLCYNNTEIAFLLNNCTYTEDMIDQLPSYIDNNKLYANKQKNLLIKEYTAMIDSKEDYGNSDEKCENMNSKFELAHLSSLKKLQDDVKMLQKSVTTINNDTKILQKNDKIMENDHILSIDNLIN